MPAPQKDGPRANRDIRGVRDVQLIDDTGLNRGVVPFFDALTLAEEAGLAILVWGPLAGGFLSGKYTRDNPDGGGGRRATFKYPPVNLPHDYDVIDTLKEIKLRPGIDKHDYDTKMKAVVRFFEEGDKVKVTLRFRGREMAHQDIGLRLLERVKNETQEIAKVESEPMLEGRQMIMILAPR